MATEIVLNTFDLSNALKPTIVVDQQAILDFTENWAPWLDPVADTIVSVTILLSDIALTLDRATFIDATGKFVTAWIDFGGAENTVFATFRIVTAAGRQDDRTLYFKMKAR